MRINNIIYNVKQAFLEIIRKYIYLVSPIIGLGAFIILEKANFIESSSDQSYINNIINLSGVLAGFLFTTYGIFMSLPNNRFIHLLKFNGYMGIIYKTLLFGIVFLISSMILGLFTNYYNLITYIFVFGISETITSVYHFYKVLKYSSKSK
ncbi:MAG: hypothetical protein MR285_04960 [Peptoniphilus sp.]|uniref:hypothetical protein n=1 Tax=Peptoniphilus sp. TaxID=1971214 RepID=UPI002600C7EB|nr:hypothetical protein [Peptoniphilus sp.]MCI5643440.1 hypothetical protein [Peptoniphilus sp.]MDD7352472.1 hypothetical protein [Peptoniphilaceae bacterium]MDU5323107.1 hypothetical protein [Peptoniphilus harei]MDY3903240.1 hypothetical protein [Peptoniphilus sp.]